MSETGKNINAAVNQLRVFNKEVAKLLETADGQMKDSGWEPHKAKCISTLNRLGNVDSWMPCCIFRGYTNTRNKHLLAFVSVILYDRDGDSKGGVDEPLVSAGWCEYPIGKKPPSDFWGWWWWTYMHIDQPERRDDGTVLSVSDPEW